MNRLSILTSLNKIIILHRFVIYKVVNTQNCLKKLQPILSEAIESISDREALSYNSHTVDAEATNQTPRKSKKITIKITGKTRSYQATGPAPNAGSHADAKPIVDILEQQSASKNNQHETKESFRSVLSSTPIKTPKLLTTEDKNVLISRLTPIGYKSDFKPIKPLAYFNSKESPNSANKAETTATTTTQTYTNIFSPIWNLDEKLVDPATTTTLTVKENKDEFNLDSFKSYLTTFDRSISMPPPLLRTKLKSGYANHANHRGARPVKQTSLAANSNSKNVDVFNFNSINEYNPHAFNFTKHTTLIRNAGDLIAKKTSEYRMDPSENEPVWTYRSLVESPKQAWVMQKTNKKN